MQEIITRKEYHAKKWKKIYWLIDCPFCNHNNILWKWKTWFIVRNISPYSWDENHLMAVPYRHIKFSVELSLEEFSWLKEVHNFVKNYFWEVNYFSATRETMWNRSVEHLHIHFIPWRLQWKYLRKMLENQWFPIKEELVFN